MGNIKSRPENGENTKNLEGGAAAYKKRINEQIKTKEAEHDKVS